MPLDPQVHSAIQELDIICPLAQDRLREPTSPNTFMITNAKLIGGTFTLAAYGLTSEPIPFDADNSMVHEAWCNLYLEAQRQRANRPKLRKVIDVIAAMICRLTGLCLTETHHKIAPPASVEIVPQNKLKLM